MSLVVRVRSETGTKRVEVDNETSVGELKAQIASLSGVFPDEQVLALDAAFQRVLRNEHASLTSVGVKHGDMLYLKSAAQPSAAAPVVPKESSSSQSTATTTTTTLTNRCNHGENAKCVNCQTVAPGAGKSIAQCRDELVKKVDSAADRRTGKEPISWLCTHGPSGKCVNCIAPLVAADAAKQASKKKPKPHKALPCEHGPHGQCVRCLPPSTDRDLDSATAACSRHGPHGSCIACIERLQARKFAVKRQTRDDTSARHVLLANAGAQAFASSSLRAFEKQVQRGALLFGWYKKSGSVVVEAFFEPPQRATSDAFVFLRDDTAAAAATGAAGKQKVSATQLQPDQLNANAERIAELLGWQCVGWALSVSQAHQAQRSASGLSAAEVARAASLQAHYAAKYNDDAAAGTKQERAFITLVVKEHVTDGGQRTGAMEAYQLSHQSATLQRRNAVAPNQTDLHRLLLTEQVLVEGAETDAVPLEFFLVPTAVKPHDGAFVAHFPSFAALGAGAPAMHDLKVQLMQLIDKKFVQRIKDFNLLVFLSAHLDMKSDVPSLCQALLADDDDGIEGFKFIISSLAGVEL